MAVIRKKIADGINLNIIKTDKFKTNLISFDYARGIRREEASLISLLPAVLKRGCKKYPDIAAIQKKSDMLYSTDVYAMIGKHDEIQHLKIASNMLDNRFIPDGTDVLYETLSLINEIVYNPLTDGNGFREDYVESEKANQIAGILAEKNNKNSYAVKRCVEEMCRDELYSVSPTVEDTEKISAEELYGLYKDFIATSPLEIYFVGSCDFVKLEKDIKDIFGGYAHKANELPKTVIRRISEGVREVTEEEPVQQSKLTLGFRINKILADGDFYKFAVFNEIFSSSPVSKLFMNVREKLSLCYYCYAIPNSLKGITLITAGIKDEDREKAQNAVFEQLEDMKNGNFTEEDIESGKMSLINGYKSIPDSQGSLVSWYETRLAAGLTVSPEETAEQAMSVTKEDIIECARGMSLDTVYYMKGTLKGGEGEE